MESVMLAWSATFCEPLDFSLWSFLEFIVGNKWIEVLVWNQPLCYWEDGLLSTRSVRISRLEIIWFAPASRNVAAYSRAIYQATICYQVLAGPVRINVEDSLKLGGFSSALAHPYSLQILMDYPDMSLKHATDTERYAYVKQSSTECIMLRFECKVPICNMRIRDIDASPQIWRHGISLRRKDRGLINSRPECLIRPSCYLLGDFDPSEITKSYSHYYLLFDSSRNGGENYLSTIESM